MKYFIYYMILINLFSMIMYGIDKVLSIKKLYRISEFTLLLMGFLGGVVGSILGMKLFRHKTLKLKFKIFNLLYLIMWCFIIYKLYEMGVIVWKW